MVRFLLFSILLLLTFSCERPEENSRLDCSLTPSFYQSTPQTDNDPEEHDDLEPVPSEALSFGADVELLHFKPEAEEKVQKAIEIIQKVVQSSEFRSRVLNFTHNNQTKFVFNRGMSNEEIYKTILEASEELLPEVDNEMDLKLKLYFSRRDIVGYTNSDELTIYMNTKFFYPYSAAEVAGNIFHEWTHKLGFDHEIINSPDRSATVPYALGFMIRELGEKYLSE